MFNNYRIRVTLIALLLLINCVSVVSAKTYVRDYTYRASEIDSKVSCRSIALEQVKILLLQELGTHIKHEINIEKKNDGSVYADEDIKAVTAGLASVDVLEEKWDGYTYFLKAKIDADPNDVLNELARIRSEEGKNNKRIEALNLKHENTLIVLKQTQSELENANSELDRLRQELAAAKTFKQKASLIESYNDNIDILTNAELKRKFLVSYKKGEYQDAFNWAKKAADRGDGTAQYYLGALYMSGQGTDRDYHKAYSLLKSSATEGVTAAQIALADYYLFGAVFSGLIDNSYSASKTLIIKADPEKAFDLYQQAAETGDADALFKIGEMYIAGQGVNKDKAKGLEIYHQLAKNGNSKAQYRLSLFSETGEKSMYWLRKSAEAGYAQAEYLMGTKYFEGDFVEKNFGKSIYWFKKAGNHGDSSAAEVLGYLYSQDKWGIRDFDTAEHWFKKLTSDGDTEKQYLMGARFDMGGDLPKDFTKAAYWYKKAADQGLYDAQIALADMYEKGEGVELDTQKSAYWKRMSEDSSQDTLVILTTHFISKHFQSTEE